MSLYVDSSALLKRYVEEVDSASCEAQLLADPVWVSGRHTRVEVRRNLARLLRGRPLVQAAEDFQRDWRRCHVVELDEVTCELAAQLAEATLCRSLDALHLASARRAPGSTFLTYDVRLAQVARSLGMVVRGA